LGKIWDDIMANPNGAHGYRKYYDKWKAEGLI